MGLSLSLFAAAAVSGLIAIWCEERASGRHAAFYFLKPFTTLLILCAAWFAPDADPVYRNWICAGLIFSMLGDMALTGRSELHFLLGLGGFLIAHLLFVWAFFLDGLHAPTWWCLAWLAGALLFFVWLLPRTGPMMIPVIFYALALSGMALAASGRYGIRLDTPALLAALGAMGFIFSDSALAKGKFAGEYPRQELLILSSYWLSIGLVAASVTASI